jgi:hypothetical protein
MSTLALAVVSMLALTALAWLARRVARVAICPVCVGVAGTWLWMLAARQAGFAIDVAMLSILLGASVVGITQWFEGRLAQGRSTLLWKALALPSGCAAAYGAAAAHWGMVAAAVVAFALLVAWFRSPGRSAASDPAAIEALEERMKNCC